ncbi:MAG: type II toxin-antitoxin system VapC family toxin [Candidatus Binatia bacterium]
MGPHGIIRRYWDASCFLALLNNDEEADDCEKILNDAKEEKTSIIVSPLVQVEVIRPKGSPSPLPKKHEETIRAFFENDYIKWRVLDRRIANLARDLCWQYGLHPRDALHLAAAIDTKCDLLETTDKGLLQRNGKIDETQLKIIKPRWIGQPGLFEKQEKS